MAWVESSTGVEEWVPESQVTTPDTPPRTVSPEEPITAADRLRAQRLRSQRLRSQRAKEVPAKAEVVAEPASANEVVGSSVAPPPLLHRYRTAGGSSFWSLAEPSDDHALIAAQYDAAGPGCSAVEPLGCSSASGPSPFDKLAASVEAEVDALFESLGGRFAHEDDRCPYSLSCNDSIALDLDRAHLTYGEITARSLLEALREGVRATRSDVLLDLGSGRGNAAYALAGTPMRALRAPCLISRKTPRDHTAVTATP